MEEMKAGLVDYLKESGHRVTVAELAYAFGERPQAVAAALQKMVDAGQVQKEYRKHARCYRYYVEG